MDKCDNRHRLSVNGRSTSPAKTCHELNGSGQEFGRKAQSKKKGRKHQSHTSEKKDWSKESVNEFQPGGCWLPPHGQQRLFTAISDPAVCGYPMSLSYSIDQFSLPMIPVYPVAQNIAYKPSVPTARKLHNTRNRDQEHPSNDEFTSLPPVNLPDFESDHQRRFSDPGLANGPLSDEESGSGNESDGLSSNESHLADRLSQVIKDNKRLETELQETKLLLQELKLEVSELRQIRSSYEPGVVCDLVREVRESMKIHQEAFLSRIQETQSSNGIDKAAKDSDDLKRKLKEVTSDRDALHERLARLEEQVKTVMVHNSVQQSNQEELVSLEREKIQLRRELQEAVDARKAAEAKVQNFEQLLNVLQKKMPNGLIVEEKCRSLDSRERESGRCASTTNCNNGVGGEGNHNAGGAIIGLGGGAGGGPSSGESLMSSFSSGSLHSPHVTMSGPVTDL